MTPNMGKCILNMMMDSIRMDALIKMCKAYKPTIAVSFLIQELSFESNEDGEAFLEKAGCIFVNSAGGDGGSAERMVNTKDTVINPNAIFAEDKQLL
jgi:hypothetical protein